MEFFRVDDLHGKRANRDFQITARQERAIRSARRNLFHKPRNGVYDPISHYHVLDVLLEVVPGEAFKTNELLVELKKRKPQILWDAVTVGRIIADMAEAMFDANGWKAIGTNRRWDALWFDVSGHPEARKAMENLLEDLHKLAEWELREEGDGEQIKRHKSPMANCPSVMPAVPQAVEEV